MDITYLGHSSFKLKGKAATVVTDPYDPKMVGLKYAKVSADIVTISHDHNDHNFVSQVLDFKKVIQGPGEYEISGVSIIGFSSYHDETKGKDRGRNTIYVIEIDNIRAVHLGDLGHKLSEDVIEEIGTVDILLIPVGGVYTIDPDTAAEVVRAIEPSITIPMHYYIEGMDENTFGKLAKVDAFVTEIGLSVERLEKLSIKKSEIGEEQKIIVLERKI